MKIAILTDSGSNLSKAFIDQHKKFICYTIDDHYGWQKLS